MDYGYIKMIISPV